MLANGFGGNHTGRACAQNDVVGHEWFSKARN
jgi:hypothetical protein